MSITDAQLAQLQQKEYDENRALTLLNIAAKLHGARNEEMEAVQGNSKVVHALDTLACRCRAKAADLLKDMDV